MNQMASTERIVPGTRTPGWNDPPPMKVKSKPVEKTVPAAVQPITHPLFGSAVVSQIPNGLPAEVHVANGFMIPNGLQNGATSHISSTLNVLQINQCSTANSENGADVDEQNITNGATEEDSSKAFKVESNRKLSLQDADLVNCLQNLRETCYDVCPKPQMKKKLEEMARKFEILSESLRTDKVSTQTLQDLHGIVNAIQEKDHQRALSLHTDLVASGNFSEISTALPAIKALIQYAVQLRVLV